MIAIILYYFFLNDKIIFLYHLEKMELVQIKSEFHNQIMNIIYSNFDKNHNVFNNCNDVINVIVKECKKYFNINNLESLNKLEECNEKQLDLCILFFYLCFLNIHVIHNMQNAPKENLMMFVHIGTSTIIKKKFDKTIDIDTKIKNIILEINKKYNFGN